MDSGTPRRVGSAADWRQVSAGSYHTCAIRTSGTLWCWGDNVNGEIGDGTDTPHRSPE